MFVNNFTGFRPSPPICGEPELSTSPGVWFYSGSRRVRRDRSELDTVITQQLVPGYVHLLYNSIYLLVHIQKIDYRDFSSAN